MKIRGQEDRGRAAKKQKKMTSQGTALGRNLYRLYNSQLNGFEPVYSTF